MSQRRDKAVRRVVDAWMIPGPRPDIHYNAQNQIRSQWPTLGRALDELSKEQP